MRFSNYYNHEGRNRNIYSRNNLLRMTMKELLERELELAYQYNTIGIPADEELMNSEFAHQYQDENGFSHWQAGEKMPDNLVQQAEVQPQTTNQSKPVTNPQPAIQEMDKENLSTQNLQQQPLNTISESISQKNGQLQGFESEMNGFAQQKKSTEFPNLGTFAPNDEKHFMVDFQSDLNKIMQQKEKSPEEQAKQNLQKYVPLEDARYTDEPYLTYEDLLGDETEEEMLARERKEIETFDKLFEEELNKNDKTQNTEPYLTYEELLGLEPQSENAKEVPPTEEMLRKQMEENGVPTGGASGMNSMSDMTMGAHLQNLVAKNIATSAEHPEREYYKVALNLDKLKTSPVKQECFFKNNELLTLKDINNTELNNAIKNSLARAKKTSVEKLDHNILENTDVVVAKPNSGLTTIAKQSPDLNKFISSHINELKSGKIISGSFPFEFEQKNDSSKVKKNKFSMSRTIHNTDVCNMKMESDGTVSLTLVDYYDFAPGGGFINDNAYRQQFNGKLQNYALIVPIRIKL